MRPLTTATALVVLATLATLAAPANAAPAAAPRAAAASAGAFTAADGVRALRYFLTTDHRERPARTTGALLELDGDALRVAVPDVGVIQRGEDTAVTVTLLGGGL